MAFHSTGRRDHGEETDWDISDDEGRYEVWIPAGAYAVLRGDEGPWVANAVVSEGLELSLDLDLPLGAIRGTVWHASSGAVVAGATVTATRTVSGRDPMGLIARGGTARTDAQGRFALRELPAGTYRLTAASGEDSGTAAEAVLPRGHAVEVRLEVR